MNGKSRFLFVPGAILLLSVLLTHDSYSQGGNKRYVYGDENFKSAQEACNSWLKGFPKHDRENPYSYNYSSATVIPGEDSSYCGCKAVGRNGKGETDTQQQYKLVYIENDATGQEETKHENAQTEDHTEENNNNSGDLKEFLGKDYAKYERSYTDAIEQKKELFGLTREEYIAIRAYTDQSWAKINMALRSKDPQLLTEQEPIIKYMKTGLPKMPVYKGTLNRTASLPFPDLAKYKVGAIITEDAFTSASYGQSPKQRGGNTAFKIESKTGRNITAIAMLDEKEVLFMPGTRFKVTKVFGSFIFYEEL